MEPNDSVRTSRRRWFYLFGLGTVGTLLGANRLFARQFARSTTPVQLPDMVYDPKLQMMVDPDTRQPLYARAGMIGADADADDDDKKKKKKKEKKPKPKPLPSVTAGCEKCPKCDDHCG